MVASLGVVGLEEQGACESQNAGSGLRRHEFFEVGRCESMDAFMGE